MRRICVFCGSAAGIRPAYAAAARAVGEEIARAGWASSTAAARIGLMGILADAVLAGGGEVDGVLPRHLAARRKSGTTG